MHLQFVYEVIAQVLSDMLMPHFPGACGRDGCCCRQVSHWGHSWPVWQQLTGGETGRLVVTTFISVFLYILSTFSGNCNVITESDLVYLYIVSSCFKFPTIQLTFRVYKCNVVIGRDWLVSVECVGKGVRVQVCLFWSGHAHCRTSKSHLVTCKYRELWANSTALISKSSSVYTIRLWMDAMSTTEDTTKNILK